MTSSGEVPVSVCTYRQSQNEEHLVVMMENVERISAFLSFSQDVSKPFLAALMMFLISIFNLITHVGCHF